MPMSVPQSSFPSGPGPAAVGAPLDLIFIEGFVGQTVIGIHETELHRPQPLQIDLCVGVPRARACDTDQIGDTVDYGELRSRLHTLLREHKVQLLEALAEQIAHIALLEFQGHWVRVRIAKPRKFDDVQAVGVVIERRRSAAMEASGPAAGGALPGRGAAVLSLIGRGMVPGSR
jgi:dihydroneopterin aldolase